MPNPDRRAFVASLAAAAVAPAILRQKLFAQQPRVRIDGATLRQRLEALSLFGRPSGGMFADGVSRVAYSDADIGGRKYVTDLLRAAGLNPRVDPAGNIFGHRAGTEASLPPILFGSHIDSVPNGGNFDGDLGSLSALAVLEALAVTRTTTRHPLEMVVWSNEEGVAFNRGLGGSRIVAGDVKQSDMEVVWNGTTRADAIRKIGGNPDRILEAVRPRGAHHCYLELHIEQGGNLELHNVPVGVVEGIVGLHTDEVTITGFANHAGTTAMADRHDALVAASYLTIAIRDIVTAEPGRQVGTVGKLDVKPNAPNVIPGVVRFTIDLRDLSAEKLARISERIRQRADAIAKDTNTAIEFTASSTIQAAAADEAVKRAIETSIAQLSVGSERLPSGALHDAQMMARLSPMGMIFVPSVRGISHSPLELTRWDDCTRGADVLLGAVLEIDRA